MTAGCPFITWCDNHQGSELRVSAAKFEQSLERLSIEASSFDFDCPFAPASLQNGIDLQRFFVPLCNPLALVHGER